MSNKKIDNTFVHIYILYKIETTKCYALFCWFSFFKSFFSFCGTLVVLHKQRAQHKKKRKMNEKDERLLSLTFKTKCY